jgi:single-strand DNA-binding protein
MNTTHTPVEIAGILGMDPQIKQSASGRKIARASLAAFPRKDEHVGEQKTQTHWIRLVGWQGVADFMEQNLRKGLKVVVKGRLSTRSYVDQEGQARPFEELVVQAIFPIPARSGQSEK